MRMLCASAPVDIGDDVIRLFWAVWAPKLLWTTTSLRDTGKKILTCNVLDDLSYYCALFRRYPIGQIAHLAGVVGD